MTQSEAAEPIPRRRGRLPGHERRQQILDAARPLFVRYGLEGTRTKQIAEAAGINDGLLYHYFDSKEAIFEAAVLEPLQELFEEVFAFWSSQPPDMPPETTMYHGMLDAVRAMEKVVPLLRVALFSDEEMGRQFYQNEFYPLVAKNYAIVADVFERRGQRFDPEYADAGWAMLLGLSIDRWFRKKPLDDPALAERLADIFLRGFGAPDPEPEPKKAKKRA